MSGVSGNGSMYNRGLYNTEQLSLDKAVEDRDFLTAGALSVHPRLAVLAIDEDNVFLSDEGAVGDSYIVITPGVLARYGETQKNYAYVDVTADIPAGYDEDAEDIDNFQLTALGHFEQSKSTINGWYKFRELRSGDIVIGNRVSKEEHVVYGGYDHQLSQKTAAGVNASYSQHDYASEDYTDYTELKLSGRVYWKAFDKTRLFAEVSSGNVAIDSRIDGFGDADYLEGTLGLDTAVNTRWHAGGSVGYQIREFDRDDIEDVEGITAAARLNGHLFDHVKAGVNFWSLIQPAVNEAGATLTETRVEPTISRRVFTDNLVASGSMVWGWVNYKSPDNQAAVGELETELVFNDREDTYWGYTLSLDWQALTQLTMTLGYSYIENDADQIPGEESATYEATRWMLRAQYNF
jgi:hypothetical protein